MMLPQAFEDYTRQLMGEALYERFLRGINDAPSTSIRLNPFKIKDTSNGEAGRFLPAGEAMPVPWCNLGYCLPTRPNFTFDPLLHAGLYYVQESSSMFICEAVRQLIPSPVLMLDLCAAPGGKSTALRSVLPEGSLLISNEPVKLRASILSENVQKFGHPDMVVTNNYPKDFRNAGLQFDAILADVPCSGEGMFRKDQNAISEWSLDNVEHCRKLQRSIVEDIWPCLRRGGLLIYSTCTINAHEDEENVAWIVEKLGAEVIPLQTEASWNISGALTGSLPAYRFIPGLTPGEGLFMAVLRKHGDSEPVKWQTGKYGDRPEIRTRKKEKAVPSHNIKVPNFDEWLDGEYDISTDNGRLSAIPEAWSTLYRTIKDKLHVIHAGVELGVNKGRDLIPSASLALSIRLKEDAFPKVNLDEANAISYLRREAILLDNAQPKGFTLASYKDKPLGFLKNIGNRANNLYPQEWRIRSSHTEQSCPNIILKKMND